MPLRAAAICGLAAPLTFVAGVLLGDLAQPPAFSPANDDISDLGAVTASYPVALQPACGEPHRAPRRRVRARAVAGASARAAVAARRPRPRRRRCGHVPRRALQARLPGHRRSLRQHVVALVGAQGRVGDHRRGSAPHATRARLRVQAAAGVARGLAADAARDPGGDRRQRRLQHPRSGSREPRGKRRVVRLARVRRAAPAARRANRWDQATVTSSCRNRSSGTCCSSPTSRAISRNV